jgi:hypothetical protein
MERREQLRQLDLVIEAFEKQGIGAAMVGGWKAEHDAQLSALYAKRRRLYDEKGTDNE